MRPSSTERSRRIWLVAAATTIALERPAHAAGESDAAASLRAAAEPSARIAWGVRLNGGVGLASADRASGGAAWRVGLDAEYWWSKNIGIGAQVGFQALESIGWVCAGDCSSESANRFSVAPMVILRGSNPTNFPSVSLALGYSSGHTEASTWCDYGGPACQLTTSVYNGWGPYGSLTGAWVFHPGHVAFASGAFAFGPLVRVDLFTLRDDGSSPSFRFQAGASTFFCWTFTTGLTIGFGVSSKESR